MPDNLVYRVGDWVKGLLGPEEEDTPSPLPTIEQMVHEAKREWQAAAQYFQEVSEPELVDYAIVNLDAAEKKYNYLLKKVRES